jgi:leucyl aminopeptidase
MEVRSTSRPVQDVSCDALIVGAASVSSEQAEKTLLLSSAGQIVDEQLDGLLSERFNDGEFEASPGALLTVYPQGRLAAKRVIVVGLGAYKKLTTQSLRRAAAIATRHAQKTAAHQVTLALSLANTPFSAAQGIQAQVEGALLGAYTFRQYQQTNDSKGITLLQIAVQETAGAITEQAINHGQILAEAANFARDLVNEPPSVLTPTELADRASSMARQFGLECEVFDKEKIEARAMGGLLAVSQGSVQPPKFIVLRYSGANNNGDKGVALVGKGITFDTGGISLKPAANMDEMKGDMGGAAAVIGAMQAIAQLKPALNVTALVPTCENMPSGSAFRPGDIVRIMNGKTIEIVNTDAEGRLVLADALSYAVEKGLSPIIDLATLTGGVVVALGSKMTGLFSNDTTLRDGIISAGEAAGEKYWPLPLDDEYDEQIASDIADIKQTGGREASSVTAAKILQRFVDNTCWAHLDIAGTSYMDHKTSHQEKGATGVGVRTLAELVLQLAK